jgi:hypothetical protein
MPRLAGWMLVGVLSLLVVVGSRPALAKTAAAPPLLAALVEQAAGRIDDTLAAVAASARGLASAYRDLSRAAPSDTPEERGRWLQNYAVKDGTVAFRDRDGLCGPEPAAKAPCPAYFFYDGENFTDETFRQLNLMNRLAPALAAAQAAFPFSWVYLTTPSQNFVIYPSLPLAEAVNNFRPTEKDFYTCADFAHKDCGWQSPYLDLAGAGMMVTVSCPAYDGSALLGVASRDITLDQLSRSVLAPLATIPGSRAAIMNRRGKAIAASDPKVAAYISQENAKAGDAVVYFRADRGLAALGLEKGVDSPDDDLNLAAEGVIERAETAKWPMAFGQGHETVLASRIATTGWYLVLVVPEKASR